MAVDEDWNLLQSMLPPQWREQAVLSGATERMRGFTKIDNLLRTLLIHVGTGCSLRETAVRAKASGLAEVSDVALLKRLRHMEPWWRWLCMRLLEESHWELPADSRGWNVRAVDGTLVKEPGARGALWRIHFSLRIPDLVCDELHLTPVKGTGTGESLQRFEVGPQDLLLADRGYAKPAGVELLTAQGAAVIVRLNTSSLPTFTTRGERFVLLPQLRRLQALEAQQWPVWVHGPHQRIAGRLCALRKSEEATRRAQQRIHRKAVHGPQAKPETLEYAGYVVVFTTLPETQFSAGEVLEWYRVRWQVELVFKRLKSLLDLGCLPKHDAQSARAWLYGKLLLALLCQKLIRTGRDISPWGYALPESWKRQRMAGL